jgi:hypothetical protein
MKLVLFSSRRTFCPVGESCYWVTGFYNHVVARGNGDLVV